jgi:hypothetical protein
MYVKDIAEVKGHLELLKNNSLIIDWELPYEKVLTRLTAAIFFVSLTENNEAQVWNEFLKYENFSFRENTEKQISDLKYRVTFNGAEKEKNQLEVSEITN